MEAGEDFSARGSEDELLEGSLLRLIDGPTHVSYRDTKLTHLTGAAEVVVWGHLIRRSVDSIFISEE